MKFSPIYQAQCFGNVEPIEYMVPYPNLRSLIIGQCIKFADNILYKDIGITNIDFYKEINRAANWLLLKHVRKGNRVLVANISSPMMEILSYAIWSVGAVLVIANTDEVDTAICKTNPQLIIDNISEKDKSEIDNESNEFIDRSNTLLKNEAVIYFIDGKGIRLSQYNLLINAYGVQKQLNILSKNTLKIEVPENTTASIVLKTILPLYAGASVSEEKYDISFSTNSDADYQIIFKWEKLNDTEPQRLYVLPETTAILAIGKTPNHVISIIKGKDRFKINGHSVMMGYLDEKENDRVFKSDSLIITR